MCVNCGARAAGRLRRKQGDPEAKILFWLAAILATAEQGLKDHDRWLLARASREGRLKGRRGTSRLPQALDLALEKPIVTPELLATVMRKRSFAGVFYHAPRTAEAGSKLRMRECGSPYGHASPVILGERSSHLGQKFQETREKNACDA